MAAPPREEGAICFLTDADSARGLREIWRNQSICLPPSNNKEQKYVSISGHAEMIDDRERVKEALVGL